ncbi:hypothetical protein T10_11848 [Trichinella papuae]|uniref:Uncharacterized protein n=1 Tax=Trichinella papuae TaxID=268474 RepID=A0A0V1M1S9_9BILA|nr:hypothetical protein T10_11848 [Trichinella papuae]
MWSCEPEDICHVHSDEGDFSARVEETVYHHLVSIWPVGASTGGREQPPPPMSASSGQEALVEAVGSW